MKKTYPALAILVALAALAFCAWLYPSLPATIPIHWNAGGEPDGWGPRSVIFWHTGFMAAMIALAWLLPVVSPRRFSVEGFASTWWFCWLAVVGLLAYVQCVHAWAAYSGDLAVDRVMMAGLALFFALSGNVMGKVRRNFWLGVRTPWTLASERVWYATHRLAARTMVAGAALALLATWARAPAYLALVALLGSVLLPAAWSLLYYKRLERSGGLEA